MKKMVLLMLILVSGLMASVSLTLDKGWHFIGFPSDIVSMKAFDNSHVEVVWGFDGKTQQWLGYSPQAEIQKKIDHHYGLLEQIDSRQGVWILNKDPWVLTLEMEGEMETIVHLYQGWNLISLPIDMTLSADLFGEETIWKYAQHQWELSTPDHNASAIAPPLNEIRSAEALWVYAKQEHTVSLNDAAGTLHTFDDRKAMEQYIETMLLNDPNIYYRGKINVEREEIMLLDTQEKTTTDETTKVDNATDTNLQESGVDESDILKHNSEYTFFYDRQSNQVVIRAFDDLAAGETKPIATLALPKSKELQGMYLQGETLIVILHRSYYLRKERLGNVAKPDDTYREGFEVRMYDIEDIKAIEESFNVEIDGTYVDSRIVDGELYLISRFTPWLEVEYPKIPVEDDRCRSKVPVPMVMTKGRFVSACADIFMEGNTHYRYDYTRPTIQERHLLPTRNRGKEVLITPERFYAPFKLDQPPTIAVVSRFGIDKKGFKGSVATVNGIDHIYVSKRHLYLTSTHYPWYIDFRRYQERETIYKFGLGDDFDYKAKGTVEGRMLNQFSMSEQGEMLRTATTSGRSWQMDTSNRVVILSEEGNRLIEKGRIEGLGKEGEQIRGVRFLGDRAYVVTFRQHDPLYVIDLSDPSEPKKMGELQINGFSSYLHPIGDRYLLTLGRDADDAGIRKGFMVQLFDVSNPTAPKRVDVKKYAEGLYGFDAEYNPRAFIYRRSDHRFAITYRDQTVSAMDVMRVDTAQGKIVPDDRLTLPASWYENRGMLFDRSGKTYGALFNANKAISQELRSPK